MAGLAGLPYFLQYQDAAQDMAMRRQAAAIQLAQWQQQQQDRQRQQAALAAAGNALPQLLGGGQSAPAQMPQLQAPPQTPNPGQPSAPAQPASAPGGGGVPLPSGPVPGQLNRPPLPAGMQRAAKPAVQPFRSLPTDGSPAQGAAPQISTPPSSAPGSAQQASGPLTLDGAIKALKDQGLSGADLMAGLGQLMPLLDAQAKTQAAQLQQQWQRELQMMRLQESYDSLRQRAEDNAANRSDREQAHADSMSVQQQMIGLRRDSLNARTQVDPNAALDADDLKFMADQYWAGDKSVFQNLGRGVQGSKNVVALRKAVMEAGKAQGKTGADLAAAQAEFEGVKSGERTLGGRTATAGMAVNEASQFADLALQASNGIDRSQYPTLNKIEQDVERGSGDPAIVQFAAYNNSLVNAYARAISPTGTPTVNDKEHAREMLNTAYSKGQYASVVQAMKTEMAAAQKSPGQVRSEFREAVTRGKPMANPPPPAGGLPQGWSVTEH